MQVPFRHGLVRYQQDNSNNPIFLLKINGGQNISLIVSPSPTLLTISHRTTDYLFQERLTIPSAWGPFTVGQDYWLYWDIDIITGIRTFGYTTIQPVTAATAPNAPAQDLHWYDSSEKVMKVRQGNVWKEVLRIFACKYIGGAVIQYYTTGTQVGLFVPCNAGYILFDDEEKPIRKITGGRRSEFIHSESILSSQAAAGLINFTFESAFHIVEAAESIPAYYLVTFYGGYNKIGVARYTDASRIVVGLSVEDVDTNNFTNFASKGFISNETWNFTLPPDTPVFCGANGEVTTEVPQYGFIQKVGHVVDNTTIYLNIESPIYYVNA